uniref:Ribonuclease III n=1 Tax=Florenciella sp. virus SA2 TaxID=3240092 RepID=A0AB39JC96_9VIRU
MSNITNEESFYNPYNCKNKEITVNTIKNILQKYNVYYEIKDYELFKRAFVHKSYVMPNNKNEEINIVPKPPDSLNLKQHSNERLEFLGDGILENVTKYYLYKRFPDQDEGFMTEKKIALVKNDHIGNLAYKMGLNEWYILSKNAEEKKTRNNFKKLGCLFEAFLGALFLDANKISLMEQSGYFSNYLNCGIGFQICQIFIESIFDTLVDWNELLENDDNYKNIFQVIIQKEFKTTPEYIVLNIDDEQRYTMGVYLCLNNINIHNIDIKDAIHFSDINTLANIKNNEIDFIYFSKASHKIKKKAEQLACQKAIELIQTYE